MNRIFIFGGANIDLCGSSLAPLRNYDSNPGTIAVSFGGVGRNIGQICALLGQNISFVTCFADDPYGQKMKKDCEKLGMDCTYSKVVHDCPSSMYIAILDSNRDMHIGMSDMRILKEMDEAMLDKALAAVHPDDWIIIDANLAADTVRYILDHACCPVAADPVSANKVVRLKPVLGKLSIFKPNQYEAQELTGIWIKDDASARQSLDWFLDRGVKEILISMADRGVLIGTRQEKLWFTHRRLEIENATGGGDTFMGAYISRRLAKDEPRTAVRYAIAAAVTTIEKDAVRRRSLKDEEIRESISGMRIEERKIA